MDQELLESISNALKKLQQEQKVLSNKILRIAEVCKNKFIKVEREQAEKHATYESRANKQIEEIENLKREEVKLSDDVTHLETEHEHVTNKISLIDDTLEEMKVEIRALKKTVDEQKVDKTEENTDLRKQCKFDNKGYCRESKNCEFFHSNSICQVYIQNGTCWKQHCRERHPKVCRYEDKCFRGKLCRYFHRSLTCDRCDHFSCNLYYCEFCTKSFCQNCTVEQAHNKNVYEDENLEYPKCESIHQTDLGCDLNSCTGTLNL